MEVASCTLDLRDAAETSAGGRGGGHRLKVAQCGRLARRRPSSRVVGAVVAPLLLSLCAVHVAAVRVRVAAAGAGHVVRDVHVAQHVRALDQLLLIPFAAARTHELRARTAPAVTGRQLRVDVRVGVRVGRWRVNARVRHVNVP